MKKVLIISPHFPPVNAADMHRVRQSLPYFKKFGWEPTVLCIDPNYVEMAKDERLLESLPKGVNVQRVKAFSTTYTRKLGLGNLGLRAFWQLFKAGNQLLKTETFDLVYFSTTVFATMPLGRLWKKKFKVPFIIDMQDPWRNDYYLTVPKEEQPPKFWFAYNLDKCLERFTIPKVDGLISVSQGYVDELKKRYPTINIIPEKILTFGAHPVDLEIALNIKDEQLEYVLDESKINIIYAGVIPNNMLFVIEAIFKAIEKGLTVQSEFKKIHFHFIGTNYAIGNSAKNALNELIIKFGLEKHVSERALRLPYFEVMNLVQKSDLAILPGTLDRDYTASKLYPYILAKIPIIAIFFETSSVVKILKELNYGSVVTFNESTEIKVLSEQIFRELSGFLNQQSKDLPDIGSNFNKYLSNYMTQQQTVFFNSVIKTK